MKYRTLIQGKDTPQVGVDECRVRGGGFEWTTVVTMGYDWDLWEFRRPIPESEVEGIKGEPTDNVEAQTQNPVSAQPSWCLKLPIQQQSVLLLGSRGPDGIAKAHPCKEVQRAYRGTVIVAAKYGRTLAWAESGDGFMSLGPFADADRWETIVDDFFHHADDLPHHFFMHLMHGSEILGYKHPDVRFRDRWRCFYTRCVRELHLVEESEEEMDARLADWQRERWQAAPSVPDGNENQSELLLTKTPVDGWVSFEERAPTAKDADEDGNIKIRYLDGRRSDVHWSSVNNGVHFLPLAFVLREPKPVKVGNDEYIPQEDGCVHIVGHGDTSYTKLFPAADFEELLRQRSMVMKGK